MSATVYPVLMSQDVATTSQFYTAVLGFGVTFESEWYVSLRLGASELAILDSDHPTVPHGFGAPARGVIVNLEVEDIGPLHHALIHERGMRAVVPLRDEDFGQRHFIVAGPDGVLIDVIQPIAPSAEFAAAYAEEALPKN